MFYFAIGQNAWGKGTTQKEAEENWRKSGGSEKMYPCVVFETDDESAYVDPINGSLMASVKGTKRIK